MNHPRPGLPVGMLWLSRIPGLSRHPDRIDRTRMGIQRSLKLYPHVQKRLRHVATRVAPPSQHSAIRAHGRVHQSVVLIACTTLCGGLL
jgi:hypothetical protein